MSIEACIAHAIQSDLDILEALPEIQEVPVDDLEPYIERYVTHMQRALQEIIQQQGEEFMRCKDAAGLCATCLEAGVNLPPKMLLKMCQTIIQLTSIDAELVLECEGKALYYVKMQLA
jgi:hypothetical protein